MKFTGQSYVVGVAPSSRKEAQIFNPLERLPDSKFHCRQHDSRQVRQQIYLDLLSGLTPHTVKMERFSVCSMCLMNRYFCSTSSR